MPLSQIQELEQIPPFFKKIQDAFASGLDGTEGDNSGISINKTHTWNVTHEENTTTFHLTEKKFIDNYPTNYATQTPDFGIRPEHLK
jgi:hypothetical protein